MTATCPVPTPLQRRLLDIEADMVRKVYAAIQDAADQAMMEVRASDSEMLPPPADYFAATVHQRLYCMLCKADPDTFAGGRPAIAVAILKNGQNIARHYWGAEF